MKKNGKRILCFVLSVVVSFGFGMTDSIKEWGLQGNSVEVQAAEADENGFVIEDGVLTKYQGKGGAVKIPEGVTSIGDRAFSYSNVTSVEIPNSVTDIGAHAFSNCIELINVEIPNSVIDIGFGAFGNCVKLTNIEIPNSVMSIDTMVFSDCTSLKKIQVTDTNPNYVSIDGILFTKNKETLVQYPAGKELQKYSIPSSVTEIENGAFVGCNKLTSIEIPNSVISIAPIEGGSSVGAFGRCTELKEIQIADTNPNYVSVDGILFTKNKDTLVQFPAGKELQKYSIPDSVISIKEGAFSGCSKLISMEIPDSVTTVGINAINGCHRLENVKISNNLTNICSAMFSGCRKLTSVEIPSSVTEIENIAFSYCSGLLAIAIPDSVVEMSGDIFAGITDTNKNFKIYCHKDSTAHTYAVEKGYAYVLVEGDIGEAMRRDLELMKVDLTLKKKKMVLKKGQKSKVKLLSKPDNIFYESKNPSIASVNSKGTVTGKKKGKTVITVTANGAIAKVKVTVKSSSANEILLNKNMKLSKKSVSLKKGTKLTIQKVSGISGKVNFRSLNKTIASVSVKGVVKAKKKGKTTILIKNGGKTVKLKVTVKR